MKRVARKLSDKSEKARVLHRLASRGDHFLEENDAGRRRVVVENVSPEIANGRYPIKRVVGDKVTVEADIFADGHDELSAVLLIRQVGEGGWMKKPLISLGNDRWRGDFEVTQIGEVFYSIEAWIDQFKSWRRDMRNNLDQGLDVAGGLITGAQLIAHASSKAHGADAERLRDWATRIRNGGLETLESRLNLALGEEVARMMMLYADGESVTRYHRELRVIVDPILAKFGAWYEMFPRSSSDTSRVHGTFKEMEAHLPRIAAMGFDVLYLPPIHPIGKTRRKGRNNSPICHPDEPGSPWAIGSREGGHKAIHPQLGTLGDFRQLVAKAREIKLEIALDIAFHCSPDHSYVTEHPEWFKRRPDGSIKHAENPPNKFEDIYPFNFECNDWRGLWHELRSVIDFWIEQGVQVFRVDNPHTKPLPFWEWLIRDVKASHPGVIFLAEAFARPMLLHALAKVGFTQCYNYFPWRNTKQELTDYFHELAHSPAREYLRANLWPNTPDILTYYLQRGGRPAFIIRLILASTLGLSYGIYGPVFELCVDQALDSSEERYLNSEIFEIRHWDLNQPGNLTELISRVNCIRRENRALHGDFHLTFHSVDNEQIIAYSKATPNFENVILTIVNLDPHNLQGGWLALSPEKLGIEPTDNIKADNLLTGEHQLWHGTKNYIQFNPGIIPAGIFRLRPDI